MSKRNYIRKKLNYAQIISVMSVQRNMCGRSLQGIRQPYVVSGIPEGFYSLEPNAILLPKRKRGEKFIVMHTVTEETIL